MAEDKNISFRGEINEQDIEKENLRPSDIDGVAGGARSFRAARPEVTDDMSPASVNANDANRPLGSDSLLFSTAEDK